MKILSRVLGIYMMAHAVIFLLPVQNDLGLFLFSLLILFGALAMIMPHFLDG